MGNAVPIVEQLLESTGTKLPTCLGTHTNQQHALWTALRTIFWPKYSIDCMIFHTQSEMIEMLKHITQKRITTLK